MRCCSLFFWFFLLKCNTDYMKFILNLSRQMHICTSGGGAPGGGAPGVKYRCVYTFMSKSLMLC